MSSRQRARTDRESRGGIRPRHEKRAKPLANIATWLAEPMPGDVRRAVERLARAPDVQRIAVMPDVHLAEGVCVGNVVATTHLLYPQAVGGDIGCGMAAVAFDAPAEALRTSAVANEILESLHAAVPIMRHACLADAPRLPPWLVDGPLCEHALRTAALAASVRREGRVEFGTLGRGNHFLEFQSDEEGRLWLMVHSGSRHVGQAISAAHLRTATRGPSGLFHLDAETPPGQAYLADVAWARAYADASRKRMIEASATVLERVMGARLLESTIIACDHNHVAREMHAPGARSESADAKPGAFFVHRKGAAPADADEPGIIPGSMGTHSYHTLGRGCPASLRSSSHGAGRALSRDAARRAITPARLEAELSGVCFDERLLARLCEEAPSAYKDVDAVMRAQRELTRVVRRLRPILVYKGV